MQEYLTHSEAETEQGQCPSARLPARPSPLTSPQLL